MAPSILDQPFVRFDRDGSGDLAADPRREWLVTNGLGSYASGSLAGRPTRSYHGLLVAALEPPVERTVLVAGSLEWLIDGEMATPLSAVGLASGEQDPRYRGPDTFWLEGNLPIWQFAIGDLLVERRLWMPAGEQATWLTYRLARGNRSARIAFTPLVVDRSFHSLESAREPEVEIGSGPRLRLRMRRDGPALTIAATRGTVQRDGSWTAELDYPEERARGLADEGDACRPAIFRLPLAPGELVGIRMSLGATLPDEAASLDPGASLEAERRRQLALLDRANATNATPAFQQLVLAADQFIVERRPPAWTGGTSVAIGRTVIAGYHWFNDWGRDTMIALPGLTLATGRPEDGAAILRSFVPFVRDGLVPNNFPDRAGDDPGYNTADASLWYLVATDRHLAATGDRTLVDELLPVARKIVDHHLAGTRFGIGVDPADGLLRAGSAGQALTWMDARIDDHAFTPRIGKPVEINALWYNALRILASWLAASPGMAAAAAMYNGHADRALAAFRRRFVRPGQDHLADVVDGPDGDELRLRPNQLFAISLAYPLLEGEAAVRVLESTRRWLLTDLGLRTLGPGDPDYHARYLGDRYERDAAYHQGTAWTWLIGAFVDAHLRLNGDPAAARRLLAPFAAHLLEAGLGSVSEIVDGDPPHTPRGCIAQAWGVAEVLRAYWLIDATGP